MSLAGSVALITGASRGIGRATARRLAADGVSLVLAARSAADLTALEGEVAGTGVDVMAVPTDVTDAAAVRRLVETAVREFGRLDIAVCAAGVGILKPALELTEADLDTLLAVNLKGAFLTAQAAATAMQAGGRRGHIVAIPGVLGRAPMANAAGYCAAKYGLTGMMKAMALDLRRAGIACSLLYLGGVDTTFWDGIAMRVQRDKMLSADEAATAVAYMLSAAVPGIVAELVLQPESHQVL